MSDLDEKHARYRRRLKNILRDRKVTNERLAEIVGAHPVTISKLLNGRMRLDEEWRERLAAALETTPAQIFDEADLPTKQRTAGTQIVSAASTRPLPVFGLAAGAVAGEHQMSDGPIDEIPAPPGLAHVVGAYALLVHGESMMPRYYPRDRLYINPHQAVVAGDHVVIQTRNHDGDIVTTWVKRYDGTDGDEVLASQYNPPARIRFKRKHVLYIHRVLPINELV